MRKVKESTRTPRAARTRKPSKGQQVGYLCVSSLDQNEVGQFKGLALEKTFTDIASGVEAERPQLEAMQSFFHEGDTVLCNSIDRLARNLDDLRRMVLGSDGAECPYRLCEAELDFHWRGFTHVESVGQCHGGICSVRERANPRAPA